MGSAVIIPVLYPVLPIQINSRQGWCAVQSCVDEGGVCAEAIVAVCWISETGVGVQVILAIVISIVTSK